MKLNKILTKNHSMEIVSSGEKLNFTLEPMTFAKLIEITTVFKGKDLSEILLDPTPLEVCTLAYCLMSDEDKRYLSDRVDIEIDDKIDNESSNIEKLYYLVTDVPINDGYNNLTSTSIAVNSIIANSLPEKEVDQKKKIKIVN